MRTMIVIGCVALASAVLAASHGRGASDETPRATLLLRAQQMADEAAKRIEPPRARTLPGWAHGGTRWGSRTEPPPGRRR